MCLNAGINKLVRLKYRKHQRVLLLGRFSKIENIILDKQCVGEKHLSFCYSIVNDKEKSFITLTPERVG
jgi:hypothetical protein